MSAPNDVWTEEQCALWKSTADGWRDAQMRERLFGDRLRQHYRAWSFVSFIVMFLTCGAVTAMFGEESPSGGAKLVGVLAAAGSVAIQVFRPRETERCLVELTVGWRSVAGEFEDLHNKARSRQASTHALKRIRANENKLIGRYKGSFAPEKIEAAQRAVIRAEGMTG